MMNSHELKLAQSFILEHPIDAARELENQPAKNTAELLSHLPENAQFTLVSHALPSYASQFLLALPKEDAAQILSRHAVGHITDILRCMPKSDRKVIIASLPQNQSAIVRVLLKYAEDVVGRHMKTDVIALPDNITTTAACDRINTAKLYVTYNKIPVVNNQQKLVGTVSYDKLLNASKRSMVHELMSFNIPTTTTRTNLAELEKNAIWDDNDFLFVLNNRNTMAGIIRYSVVRKVTAERPPIFTHPSISSPVINLIDSYKRSFSALFGLLLSRSNNNTAASNRRATEHN